MRRRWHRVRSLLAVLGPGFITANADNDVGSILTFSQAGASLGYALLWTLLPITLALIVIQEMATRLGVATGKGLAELIREQFGARTALLAMFCLSLASFGNIMAEFAGLASAVEMFGISRYVGVPAGAVLLFLLVIRGRSHGTERVLLLLSMVYFVYPVSAVLARPDWKTALHDTFVPQIARTSNYMLMIIALAGSSISPWMQFYLQSAVVEKGIDKGRYETTRWDTILGCLTTNVVGFFIVAAAAATLHRSGHGELTTVAQAAAGLRPVAGPAAFALFAAGLINGAMLSATLLPLAIAYDVCEVMGFESGLKKRFREAPLFYSLYAVSLFGAAALVLIPGLPLLDVILLSQVANGVLLPLELFFVLKLINRPELVGEYCNSRFQNLVAFATAIALSGLTAAWFWTTFRAYK